MEDVIVSIEHGYIDFVKNKINKDNVNDVIDQDNWTALHWASCKNKLDIAKYLLSIGADWNSKSKLGNTPVEVAILNNSIEVKEFLQFYIRFNKK